MFFSKTSWDFSKNVYFLKYLAVNTKINRFIFLYFKWHNFHSDQHTSPPPPKKKKVISFGMQALSFFHFCLICKQKFQSSNNFIG